jgi:hypothetical protein
MFQSELFQKEFDALGINSNDTFRAGKNSLRLVLDNSFGSNASDFVTILVENLSTCSVVDNISLRDNRLENEALRLIIALSQNCNIKSIDLGGTNFSTKKNSNVLKVLTELIRWASKEDSVIY